MPPSLYDAHPHVPISDYAVIGDCRTLALVSRGGSVDWLCLPHFSGSSLFGALLDHADGGRFAMRPRDVERTEQRYLPDSNVVETIFHCKGGTLRLTDGMRMPPAGQSPSSPPEHELLRIAQCLEGRVRLDAVFAPRPDYARDQPRLQRHGASAWVCQWRGGRTVLHSDMDLTLLDAGTVHASEELGVGDERQCVLVHGSSDSRDGAALGLSVRRHMDETVRWWRDWCSQCVYDGPYRPAVMRSCLILKLLTYSPSGAMVAAGTTSLPVNLSGARNWDYRYCWLRDTSMVLQSFSDMGFRREGDAFLHWLLDATDATGPQPQVVYDVCGERLSPETELSSLQGHCGIGPVRVGNHAQEQLQLDIFGEMLLTAYGFVERGGTLVPEQRKLLAGFGLAVCELWRQPDQGIWEIRGAARHNTYSKLMCWVALDRLLGLHQRIDMGIDEPAITTERDRIRADIERNGFNARHDSYVGYYGGDAADASLLLLARYGFLKADDPRMIGTCRYIEQTLSVDGLLYRYPPGGDYDGVEGGEGLFVICSYWLVDYLARRGDLDRAEALYERLIGMGNHVGLFSEQMDADTHAALGNFPQAFSHVGMITAGYALAEARRGKRDSEIAR